MALNEQPMKYIGTDAGILAENVKTLREEQAAGAVSIETLKSIALFAATLAITATDALDLGAEERAAAYKAYSLLSDTAQVAYARQYAALPVRFYAISLEDGPGRRALLIEGCGTLKRARDAARAYAKGHWVCTEVHETCTYRETSTGPYIETRVVDRYTYEGKLKPGVPDPEVKYWLPEYRVPDREGKQEPVTA